MDLDPESIRSLVSSWVGGAAEEEEDTESKSSVLYEGRPERLGLGAKFLPHKRVSQVEERRMKGRLLKKRKRSKGKTNDDDDDESDGPEKAASSGSLVQSPGSAVVAQGVEEGGDDEERSSRFDAGLERKAPTVGSLGLKKKKRMVAGGYEAFMKQLTSGANYKRGSKKRKKKLLKAKRRKEKQMEIKGRGGSGP